MNFLRCESLLFAAFCGLLLALLAARAVRDPLDGVYATTLDGRIILDYELLSRPRYPALIEISNFVLRALPKPWLKAILPLDLDTLEARARVKAEEGFSSLATDGNKGFTSSPFAGKEVGIDETFWRSGLEALLEDLDGADANGNTTSSAETAGLSPLGRFMGQQQIIGALATQLRVAKLIKLHPEILKEKIEAPLILFGLPRTGTTYLLHALAHHPELRSLRYFEGLEPVAGLDLGAGQIGTENDPRVLTASYAVEFVRFLRPLFHHMHEMGSEISCEEIHILSTAFSSMLWECEFRAPSFSKWFRRVDQTPSYRYLKTLLQIIQWQDRQNSTFTSKKWILKTPQHSFQMKALRDVFPDLIPIVTTRNIVPVVKSTLALLTYTFGTWNDRIDLQSHGQLWMDRLCEIQKGIESWHRFNKSGNSKFGHELIEAKFESYIGSYDATLELLTSIAEKAGLSHDPVSMASVRAFVQERSKPEVGTRKRLAYDLSAFGLSENAVIEKFGKCQLSGQI